MNKARLIKNEDEIYLAVTSESLNNVAYFRVELFATKIKGKIINLTKQEMLINLTREE
jgi:hypothetical protein